MLPTSQSHAKHLLETTLSLRVKISGPRKYYISILQYEVQSDGESEKEVQTFDSDAWGRLQARKTYSSISPPRVRDQLLRSSKHILPPVETQGCEMVL